MFAAEHTADNAARIIDSQQQIPAPDQQQPALRRVVDLLRNDFFPHADQPLDRGKHRFVPMRFVPIECAAAVGVIPAFHPDLRAVIDARHSYRKEQDRQRAEKAAHVFPALFRESQKTLGVMAVQ